LLILLKFELIVVGVVSLAILFDITISVILYFNLFLNCFII